MIMQAYNDGEVKIFKGQKLICSFTVQPPLKDDVDLHLKLLRLKRRTKWVDVSWGSEASVRFS
jgi:hypothetical protein